LLERLYIKKDLASLARKKSARGKDHEQWRVSTDRPKNLEPSPVKQEEYIYNQNITGYNKPSRLLSTTEPSSKTSTLAPEKIHETPGSRWWWWSCHDGDGVMMMPANQPM
jgi:hypothetical protein